MCSHFNIEDGRRYATFSVYYSFFIFQKGKNSTGTQKSFCAVCGEGAVTGQTSQKWFTKSLGTIDILAK